jgi:fermentation-respiration switch protein FrsA (DUF1100 family)
MRVEEEIVVFLQVVLGRAADAAAVRRLWERWCTDLAPGAVGLVGATGGVTTDRRAVLITGFESEHAARANAQRPEQDSWWAETVTGALADLPEVLETADVTLHGGQGWETARFVQVMRAQVRDRRRFEAIEDEITPQFMRLRPDLLAAYRAWFPGGSVAAIDYFTSEAEARAGEQKEMPDAFGERFREWMSLLNDVEWFDLADPWMGTP